MLFLGIDLGTSAIKVCLFDAEAGRPLAFASEPQSEMRVQSVREGWAEQDPEEWWTHTQKGIEKVLQSAGADAASIGGIGISYQMHGLVLVDKDHKVLRPSIIWSDSRAVPHGQQAFDALGSQFCLQHYLNSPGNFTAAKLHWVKENEPEIYGRIHKMMLPGDFLAMKLSGEISTTIGGLSEGIMWDFQQKSQAVDLYKFFGIEASLIPDVYKTFEATAGLSNSLADAWGMKAGTPISYRAGDQPNNAFSLGVINPGEIAATAGTSGVVYGVSHETAYDPLSRVNTFAHVNYSHEVNSLGILLCVNGTGILNNWLKRNLSIDSYEEMNQMAGAVAAGSDGLIMLPFGNGAERVLNNRLVGAQLSHLDLNTHTHAHMIRAAHEGIAYSFKYGMDIMGKLGMQPQVIRAGKANMFLSKIFRETLSDVNEVTIELYETNGAEGAARGAAVGTGFYANPEESAACLTLLETIEPNVKRKERQEAFYEKWVNTLQNHLKNN
ncbi:MAG: FGGY family carbohydrate kinase [Bacteroidota bacterium]